MSPEQAMGVTGERIDARSDIYSLGMVVYQMLTGKVAFESDSWMRVMYMHLNESPVPPSQLRPELARFVEVEGVVLKALEKDREDRQQSVAEFAAELDAAYAVAKSRGDGAPSTAVYTPTAMADRMGFAETSTPGQKTIPSAGAATAGQAQAAAPETYKESQAAQPAATGRLWSASKLPAALALGTILIGGLVLFLFNRPAANRPAGEAEPAAPVARPAGEIVIQNFEFDVLTANKSGQVSLARRAQANYYSENLGGLTMEMIEIPAGKFLMGSADSEQDRESNEGPQREVSVPAFYMGKYEVTQDQWAAVVKLPKVSRDLTPNPSAFKTDGKTPVQNVSWWEAVEFCERLSRFTGRKYRLPAEAEWEYACRAGTRTAFHFGDIITSELVNFDARYPYGSGPKGAMRRQPVAVGSLGAPNAFGLYNMHGNLAEWCLDPWHDNYIGAPNDGQPREAGSGADFRVLRGGSWYDGGASCRSAERDKEPPDRKLDVTGFRVVMVPAKN
jgi:formylglycine-generating enzyme required for sulfatase activity